MSVASKTYKTGYGATDIAAEWPPAVQEAPDYAGHSGAHTLDAELRQANLCVEALNICIAQDDEEIARLQAVNAEMLRAIKETRALVSEAALTGFNCHDGHWAERLYANQAVLSDAIAKAEGQP